MRALFPMGRDMQAVLINTAGGVTGGDRFSVTAKIDENAALTLTTQAAERAYKAQTGQTGLIDNRLQVARGGHVNWLPQETILFDGCALNRRLVVDLAKDATALIAEPLVLGRAAMGEQVRSGHFSDRIALHRDGKLLFLDCLRLGADMAAHMDAPWIAGGAQAMAAVILVHPSVEAHLDPVRAMLPATAGASLILPDLLFIRILATDSHLLRQALIPVLMRLSNDDLPRPWMI